MVSPTKQVSRAITEGRALDRLRCICLLDPRLRVVFVHLVATLNRTGLHGVSHLTMHSSFTPTSDACPTAQFGQVVLSECDACFSCLAVWFRLQVCYCGSNVSRLDHPRAAVLLLHEVSTLLVPYWKKRSNFHCSLSRSIGSGICALLAIFCPLIFLATLLNALCKGLSLLANVSPRILW